MTNKENTRDISNVWKSTAPLVFRTGHNSSLGGVVCSKSNVLCTCPYVMERPLLISKPLSIATLELEADAPTNEALRDKAAGDILQGQLWNCERQATSGTGGGGGEGVALEHLGSVSEVIVHTSL